MPFPTGSWIVLDTSGRTAIKNEDNGAQPGATAQRPQLSRSVLAHVPRQLGSWLTWDVRQKHMNTITTEEIWFARICAVLGAKELLDAVVHMFTILKTASGLPVVAHVGATPDYIVITLLISSAVGGIYLLAGGSLLSRIAFGRAVSCADLTGLAPLPEGNAWLALGFRGFGANLFIQAFSSLALTITYHFYFQIPSISHEPLPSVVRGVTTLQQFFLSFILLWAGGFLATVFINKKPPNQALVPTPASVAPAADAPVAPDAGAAHL